MFNFTKTIKSVVFASAMLATISISDAAMADGEVFELPVPSKIKIIHDPCLSCSIQDFKAPEVAAVPSSANIDFISLNSGDTFAKVVPTQTSLNSTSDLASLAPAAGGGEDACGKEARGNGALEKMGLFAGGAPTDAACAESSTDKS